MSYAVKVTEGVIDFIEESITSERVYSRVYECMELLGAYPRMGRSYDPEYAAARPPFPCRRVVVSDTPFALYYTIDEDVQELTVFYMEFAAGNLRTRFHLV